MDRRASLPLQKAVKATVHQPLAVPRMTPSSIVQRVMALQRTAGNRATGRLLAAPPTALAGSVQRLDIAEKPVKADDPPLTSIRQLTGGHKGDVYLLENGGGKKLVVKFQHEAPKEAVLGTMFQQKAGANTPRVRPATHFDFLRLNDALEPLNAGATAGVVTQFRQAKTTFENVLLMDFAEGQTIMKVMDEDPQRLGEALKDRQFQFSLGRLLAADALSGNPDRAMAITTKGGGVRGWYHEQNLFIHQTEGTWGKYAAVAIDNAFAPTVTNMTKPFGKILGAGVQYGSMAAASTGHFEEEAGLLYDRILEELLKRHDDVAELVGDLRPHRAEFADNVARTAELVMNNTIGKHGQGWKQQLRKGGATEENIQDFSHRKRYMRLLRLGCEPELAHEVALDDTAYHKFILTEEKGYSETKAEATLKRGKSAYRRAKNS